MNQVNNNQIAESIGSILYKMVGDDGFDEEIRPTTWFVADLGLESIDIVVLGTTLQQQLDTKLPFTEYLCQVGQREVRDIRFDEFVAFVEAHTKGKAL